MKKTALKDIRKVVVKTNGRKPTLQSISEAASSFLDKKAKRGRKVGQRDTTKEEDKQIMKAFHHLRPPGHGVVAREVRSALPKKLQKKISERTIIRRLAEEGYYPEKKLNKSDPSEVQKTRRVNFCKKHKDKLPQQWPPVLQAVADIKEFTWYPQRLKPKHKRLRAPWTYMRKAEKKKGPFLRPKRWFPKKEYRTTKKQKVFGLSTSNGKILAFKVPTPWSAGPWGKEVKKRVAPFLRKAFPGKRTFVILLDGEKIFHTPAVKALMKAEGISVFPGWPPHSPEINPQENVWPWAENYQRDELEEDADTFDTFGKNCVKAVKAYPSAHKLVPSMSKRIKQCLERNGGALDF